MNIKKKKKGTELVKQATRVAALNQQKLCFIYVLRLYINYICYLSMPIAKIFYIILHFFYISSSLQYL